MATDIIIPTLGESVSEGVISTWLKGEGETVDRDEPVLELETDKITVEVPAPAAGVVKMGAKEGDTVTVGAVVGSIDESATPSTPSAAKPAASKAEEAGSAPGESKKQERNGAVAASEDADVRATPLARKLASEKGVDLTQIAGTGPGNRVREQDVLAHIDRASSAAAEVARHVEAGAASPTSPTSASAPRRFSRDTSVDRMSPLRQRVAQRLVEAQQTAAMLTTFNECDMTNVMELRGRHKDAFLKKHGVKLGFMSFFAKACVSALETVPAVNSQITESAKGPAIKRHHYCDIAFAVGTPKGLVVPVLRNVESLSFSEIESGLVELATRARDGKLTLEEMQGGTFTVSNGGVYGSMLSTPILNPPQSGILGMHNIIRRPVERPDKPGSGDVAVRPMMYLALSYDHRIVDGQGAVTFLKHVKECIEDPERLLLEV